MRSRLRLQCVELPTSAGVTTSNRQQAAFDPDSGQVFACPRNFSTNGTFNRIKFYCGLQGRTIVQEQKYIELFLVADNRVVSGFSLGQSIIREELIKVCKDVSMLVSWLRSSSDILGTLEKKVKVKIINILIVFTVFMDLIWTMLLQYQKMNKDMQKLRQRIFEIVNFVNLVSHPIWFLWKFPMLKRLPQTDHSFKSCLLFKSGWCLSDRSSSLVCPAGLQTPEDLHCSGGSGSLVEWRSNLYHQPGWSKSGCFHKVEELWAEKEERSWQCTSHQVWPVSVEHGSKCY